MAKGKSGAKSSLKTALQAQQHRLKKKDQATRAAQIVESTQRGKKSLRNSANLDVKGKGKEHPQRVTIPFKATDRILLVGEGNFSFAYALLFHPPSSTPLVPASQDPSEPSTLTTSLEFLPSANVTATAYDTEEECYTKYPDARENVAALKSKGAEVLFGVDATRLERTPRLKGRRWDRVVWNFPHAGEHFQALICAHHTQPYFALYRKGYHGPKP
jgi:25S rRNA (uracil2634-N3)-methyltransferase